MKATHLITLSARIEELTNLQYETDEKRFLVFYMDINKHNDLLKQPVTLSQFVPCKNGVPLEKPVSPCKTSTQKACSQELEPCECSAYHKQYNEAQKSVIFEGWEVFSINDYVTKVVKDNWLVGFCLKNKWITITTLEAFNKNDWDSALNIQTLADLAAATQLNPLKLKLK